MRNNPELFHLVTSMPTTDPTPHQIRRGQPPVIPSVRVDKIFLPHEIATRTEDFPLYRDIQFSSEKIDR
jgi:hypothetical protein